MAQKITETKIIEILKNKSSVLENREFEFVNDLTKGMHCISYLQNKYGITNKLTINNCKIFIKKINSNYIDTTNIEIFNCDIFVETSVLNTDDSIGIENLVKKLNQNNNVFSSKSYISGHNVNLKNLENDIQRFRSDSIFLKEIINKSKRIQDIRGRYDIEYFNSSNGVSTKDRIINPTTKICELTNTSGDLAFYGVDITLNGCEDLNLKISPGCTIHIVEAPSKLSIDCDGKFNIFYQSEALMKKTKIDIINGSIYKTNFKKAYKPKFYKFKTFMNVDFTDDYDVSQFYGCYFKNCCFNQYQYILESRLKGCYFFNGKSNIDDCEIS